MLKRVLNTPTTNVEDKSIWQRFRRNVSISVLGSGFSVAFRLGQTVLLTRYLRIDDYGRLLIVLNLFIFLDSFFGLRVSDVMFRFFQPLKERRQARALKALLLFSLGVCLASGLLVYGGVFILSSWLAGRVYSNPSLAPLFGLYGLTILITSFSGFYEPILRMYDRFPAIVVPQVLGNVVTFALLCIYFSTNGARYDLRVVVVAFAIGLLVQSIPPLLKSLRLVGPFLGRVNPDEDGEPLTKYRPELLRCFFNSNLSGYLKFAINPGDIFVLGLISTPTQVALYGLAKQLTSPLAMLQTTIQTAIIPEITSLIARAKLEQLQRLIARYVVSSFVLGGLLFLGLLFFGRLLIMHFFEAQYAMALPVFYTLALAAWLLLVFLMFRPLAVSLDLLKWHNLALLISAIVVVLLIVANDLNALTMAYVQLGEAAVLRLSFSLLVWKRLRHAGTGSHGRKPHEAVAVSLD
jgi:O-antigen/teichoic acid export membrane protein